MAWAIFRIGLCVVSVLACIGVLIMAPGSKSALVVLLGGIVSVYLVLADVRA